MTTWHQAMVFACDEDQVNTVALGTVAYYDGWLIPRLESSLFVLLLYYHATFPNSIIQAKMYNT